MRCSVPAFLALVAILSSGCAPAEAPEAGGTASEGGGPAASLPPGAQAWSLLGEPLYPPELPPEVLGERQMQLDQALEDLAAHPDDADAIIWAGRRQGYLGDYRGAIETFSRGIELYPGDARFLRHRGHRYITVREFDRAITDFRRAVELVEGTEDEVEPDGQPNALGIPTSTLHFNIWYHYGLAHYLKGEFGEAADLYWRCMEVSAHPDSRVATAHWLYMSLRRSGQEEEAARVIQGMELETLAPEVIESGSYLELLYLYAGREGREGPLDPGTLEGATKGYGIGNWMLYNGDVQGALEVFRDVLEARDQWGAFGYIAAEAEVARAPIP